MNLFTKVIFALFTFSVFSIAAEQRRAEIYVDEDLYKDAEVLAAVQKYAGAVEKELNFKIDIKSFPAALVLDSTTLNTSPKFKQKSTAARNKIGSTKPAITAADIIAERKGVKYKPLFYIASFLIPFLLTFVSYIGFDVYPFGERSVLTLDLNGQYIYYF